MNDPAHAEARLALIHLGRVDLAIAGYRLIVITGPRASGKTTLARTITKSSSARRLPMPPMVEREMFELLVSTPTEWLVFDDQSMVLKFHSPALQGHLATRPLLKVIITGDVVTLSRHLERHAFRIELPELSIRLPLS